MDKATVEKLLRARAALADHVGGDDVDMSVFAEIGLDLDDILWQVAPTARKSYEDILGQLRLDQVREIADAMRELGTVLDNYLGKFHVGVVGDAFNTFYEAAEIVVANKVADMWEDRANLIDSWYGKQVTLLIMTRTPQVVRGELWRGRPVADDWDEYVIVNETQRVEFGWMQLVDVHVQPDGTRVFVADSPHCGISFPKIESRP